MNTLVFLGIVLSLSYIVNYITKDKELNRNKLTSNNQEAKIEVGFPVANSSALHMNSTIEPPTPIYNYVNEYKGYIDEEEEAKYTTGYTKNMFVESHYELNISLFERELTEQIVIDAYEKVLNEHMDNITNGIPAVFNITEKKEAKEYLLAYLKKQD